MFGESQADIRISLNKFSCQYFALTIKDDLSPSTPHRMHLCHAETPKDLRRTTGVGESIEAKIHNHPPVVHYS